MFEKMEDGTANPLWKNLDQNGPENDRLNASFITGGPSVAMSEDEENTDRPVSVRSLDAEWEQDLEKVEIDLGSKQQMEAGFRSLNSRLSVPALELDDGSILTESVAICRYLEEIHPEPALFGTGAFGKATVEMWHRRVELEGLIPISEAVRNLSLIHI